ncbi:CAP domain-containing protein [Corynebacterium crudilactis]|uniref:SCP domain-containing protein n=1 Tax=Corynebacterium crudilactis TaxID=1652495 RepID=A0A172QQX7_9CORY|nr:CAP domain-containing protein [Corynebacterium crudilactis]ANE03071.1 hypothetical protein ccrud_01805 [Corynebacterium crudilactis]
MWKITRKIAAITLPFALALSVIPNANAFSALSSNFTNSSPATNTNPTNNNASSVELEVLDLINKHRAAHGVAPAQIRTDLMENSKRWSQTMSREDNFRHSGQNVAENIFWASNSVGAEKTFTSWKNSPGHNRNMLNGNYSVMGIGIVYGANGSTWATLQLLP